MPGPDIPYQTDDGRRILPDGGQAASMDSGGGLADDTAGMQRAEDMAGGAGSGFQTAVAHSQHVLHASRGNQQAARQAHKEWQRRREQNSQLRKDEWVEIDDQVTDIAQRTRVMLQDLIGRGLTIPLDLGTLRWEWERLDDMTDALVDMGAETGGHEDLPDFDLQGIPLPVVHKSFALNMRKLRASRNRGEPLDTTAAAQATRVVNRRLEDIVANGIPEITVDGDTVYGYTNHPDRNPVTGSGWDTASADEMITDVLNAVEAIEDDNRGTMDMVFYLGREPFQQIRATNAGTDDKRGVLQLVRDRLSSEGDFPGITFKRADHLNDDEGVLVEMSRETVQLAIPSDVQAIEWESKGGMVMHNKIMGSQIPVLKSDRQGQMGLTHVTGL